MSVEKGEPAGREPAARWEKLTWSDLVDWAGSGSVTRGKGYQKQGYVRELCVSEAGVLLAWVQGRRRYATRVHLDTTKHRRADRIVSRCSCPVGLACKHAVAVLLEYLTAIEKGTEVPEAPEGDERWTVLGPDDASLPDYGEVGDLPHEDGVWEGAGAFPRSGRPKRVTSEDLRSHLESKSPEALVGLIVRFCERHPEIRRALEDDCALAAGRHSQLLRDVRREMLSVTAEDAWWNGWKGEGSLPDYSGLETRLRMLLGHGQADGIVELGREFLERGIDQIERSSDEGETAWAIGKCMKVVGEALMQSGRPAEEKILYAIESMLADDYGLCEGFAIVLDQSWNEAVWSAVADRLRDRLEGEPTAPKKGDDWIGSYRREQLSGWAIEALDKGGRSGEGTRLCVAEAEQFGSYTRAVRRLLQGKDHDGAGRLAKAGLEGTPPLYAGILDELQDLMCEAAEETGDLMLPAAVAADRFFRRPSVAGLREVMERSKKAGCEEVVTNGAMAFLETGRRPDAEREDPSEGGPEDPWPLPPPPEPEEQASRPARRPPGGPHYQVLIDLAIDENRPDDVLKWYDELDAARKRQHGDWRAGPLDSEEAVAEAVASSHPDRAIAIYRQAADYVASKTNTRTYPEAGRLLKRAKRLLEKNGRGGEWATVVEEFRSKHRRKRRLMEVIDGIEGRPIVKKSRK